MAKLSAVMCAQVKARVGRDKLLGDGNGLYLRVRTNGTKTWLIDYLFRGNRRKYKIGIYDASGSPGESISDWLRHGRLSLTQARAIAGEWKAARRSRHDPVIEWESQLAYEKKAVETQTALVAAAANLPTVSDAASDFLAKHMVGKKSESAIRYRLDRLTARIGDKKIRDVSRADVIAALEGIAEGRVTGKTAKQLAGEVLTQAKRLWRFAEARDWIASSCIERLTRKDFDARPVKRDVTLRIDELLEVWRALDDPSKCKSDPVTIAALRILILTGQREREVTDAEWTEFDLGSGLWRIPASRTKKGRAHLVHLAPEAVAILESLQRITGKKHYVFASPIRKGQAIFGRSVNNALGLMFDRKVLLNVTRCTVHDLRRTLITRLPDLGFEPFLAHKIANHALSGVMAHYNHNEYLDKREAALKAWAALLCTPAKPANNVVPIRAAA